MTGLEVDKLFYKCVYSWGKKQDLALKRSVAYTTHSYKPTLATRLNITSGYIDPLVEIEQDTRMMYTN